MTNTQLAELLLVRLYDLAESQGHSELHALNEIAAEFGITDKSKVFNLAKTLEGRGLIQGSFTSGPAVKARITGEGVLLVERGGDTGVIRDYREHPQSFSVAIDQSTHFHAAVANSNVVAHSPEATQRLAPAAATVEVTDSLGSSRFPPRTSARTAVVDQKQMCSRVEALLSERLAFAQQEFTEEIWRVSDDFNAKGMLGGSAFSHAVLRLSEAEIRKRASLINNAWREVLNAFREAAVHVDSGFLSQHAEEKLRESAAQVKQMARSTEKDESAALFVRLEEQLSRSVGSLEASLEILLAELKHSSGVPKERAATELMEQPDPRRVFVVHGRNQAARSAVSAFLRSIDLKPIEWSEAVRLTGEAAPFVGQVVEAGFSAAQAVVVILTGDDLAHLKPTLLQHSDPAHEREPTPQARPNVLFEAGYAFAKHPKRTIILEFGRLRPFSDVQGRHVIRMNDSGEKRQELADRLAAAGCSVSLLGTDWHSAGDFSELV